MTRQHIAVDAVSERGTQIAHFGPHEVRFHGHLELIDTGESIRPVRLPTRYWPRFPPIGGEALRVTVSRPSGVRLSFVTAASTVRLRVRCTRLDLPDFVGQVGAFVASVAGTDSTIPCPVDAVELLSADGCSVRTQELRDSSTITLNDLGPGDTDVELWFPQAMMVDILGVEADGPVRATGEPSAPRWIHHGSSISQCAEADLPTQSWPVVAARRAGLEVTNLGFSGHCLLDPFVADAIAHAPAEVISLKLGANVVGNRAMDQRTFGPAVHGFLDRIRSGHPTTPILVVSPLLWPGNEQRTGPTTRTWADGRLVFALAGSEDEVSLGALSLEAARDQLAQIVSVRQAEGEVIDYLDGRALYGERDAATRPLPDGLHPDGPLYELIARRFDELVFRAGEHGTASRLVESRGLPAASTSPGPVR